MLLNRWFMLAVIFIARMSMAYQFQSIASVGSFLTKDFGLEYAAIGSLIGLYSLPGVLLSFPGGILGKRFGDKRITLIGLLLMTVASLLVGFSKSYLMAAIGRVLGGTGATLMGVMMTKMVADWFANREIITAMAIFVNSWPAGIGLALVTQPSLAHSVGWPGVFQVAAASSAIGFLLMAFFYQPPETMDATIQDRGKNLIKSRVSAQEAYLITLAGLIWALYNVAYVIVFSFGPPLLVSRGMNLTAASVLISLNTWLILGSVPVGGWLAERLRFANFFMFVGFIIFGSGLLLLTFDLPLFSILIIGVIGGLPAGPIMALPVSVLKPENRAIGMGIFATITSMGMATLPVVAGWTIDITNNPGAPFYFGAGLLLLCIIVLVVFLLSRLRLLTQNI